MATTYLITGGNRGLGKGLVEAYLRKPDNIVVAAVRDPAHPTSKALFNLPTSSSTSLIVVKIENTSETDALDAVSELQSRHGIRSLDIVVANAGMARLFPRVEEVQVSDLLDHYKVNAISVALLFQATLPLLKKSQKTPKFVAMGTTAATIGDMESITVPNAAYGPSKAALNWLIKKIHIEHEDLVAFPIHPGFVQTDGGNESAKIFGLEKAHITIEESVSGLLKVIEESTRNSTSGNFMVYDSTTFSW